MNKTTKAHLIASSMAFSAVIHADTIQCNESAPSCYIQAGQQTANVTEAVSQQELIAGLNDALTGMDKVIETIKEINQEQRTLIAEFERRNQPSEI